tara:strand:- start:3364 stop:4491 length:1128 start_codon:yes stop_codon:yes gene_type:complete
MKHAKLSASGSARWLACPGSVKAAEEFKSSGSSPAAAEGTCAHELAAMILADQVNPNEYLGLTLKDEPYVVVDKDMVRYAQEYADYCEAIPGRHFVERRVDFSDWVPEGFGTSDCIVYDESTATLHVIDLKYGKGIAVSPVENTQGMLYALGAYKLVGNKPIHKIIIHIYQPRMQNISEWTISAGELLDWADEYVKPRAELCFTDDAPREAGDKQCQWCPAKPTCQILKTHVEAVIGAEFDDLDLPVIDKQLDLGIIMQNKKLIESYLKAVEGFIFSQLESGESVPGYKLVTGRSVRAWADAEEAEQILRTKRYKVSEIFTQKLISPTQAQKLLGNKYSTIDYLVIKPQGKPALAVESDKRPALKLNCVDDFDIV